MRTTSRMTTSSNASLACAGDECSRLGGNAYCANIGLTCRTTATNPCFTCGGSSTSRSTSRTSTSAVSSGVTSGTTSRTSSVTWTSRSWGPLCGNGTRDPGEQCGEPGLSCGTGMVCDARACICDKDIQKPFCGDGRVNSGEQCGEPGLSCPAGQECNDRFCLCSGSDYCGDGVEQEGEQCNEPRLRCGVGSFCEDRSCLCMDFTREPHCGNNILEVGEECDDGDILNFDGCSAFCEYEDGACGDGILQQSLGEQCEPSIHSALLPFRCSDTCRIESDFCGNGLREEGEECDDGPNNANIQNARCRLDCSFARCGDDILDSASEECDDGNRLRDDGCDRYCKREISIVGRRTDSWTDGIALPASLVELPFLGVKGESRLSVIPGFMDLLSPSTPTGGPGGDQQRPGTTPQTGPGIIAVVAAGAAAGVAWMRRRRL